MPGVDDFNALRDLARIAAETPPWCGFARYCELRAKGLRKPAFAAMTTFIAEATAWPYEDRRQFAVWICELGVSRKPEVLPQPLFVQLVEPTLEQWLESDELDPRPAYFLGLFATWSAEKPDSVARFESALARDAAFEPARLALVDGMLGDVGYSQHHLPEAYIGSPAKDLMLLNAASVLLESVRHPQARQYRLGELEEYRRQAEHWREHGFAPPGTKSRSVTVYYDD